MLLRLAGRLLLRLAVRIYRPSGSSTQMRGVTPHVVLPSDLQMHQIGQAYRPFPMKEDEIAAAEFTPFEEFITPGITKRLNDRSAQRRSQSPYFQKLGERIKRYEVNENREVFSLIEERFLTQHARLTQATESPSLPGIPQVKLDDYLNEVLATALDYAEELNGRVN